MQDNNKNCYACYACDACYACRACYGCYACYGCHACRACYGCYACRACRACYACYGCDACYYSYGLTECKGVYKSIFCTGQEGGAYLIFGKQSTEERYEEIWDKLNSFNWFPYQTNGFELYRKNGNDWNKVDMNEFKTKGWADSWKDMPKELLSYITSLTEFDATIFKKVTGIDVDDKKSELLKKADELIKKAEELKKEANNL